MPDIPKMLLASHEVKNSFDKIFMTANIQESGEAHVSARLYLTISEQFAAVLHLIEGGFSSHAPIVVRSMLEGLASLRNLVNDPAYLDQMKFDNARSNIKFFDEYASASSMQGETEAIAKLTEWKDKAQPLLNELKTKGFKTQDIAKKFEKANMLEHYVIYRFYCSFAHNQLTTLTARHAGQFHEETPPETTASVMDSARMDSLPRFRDVVEFHRFAWRRFSTGYC